MKILLVAFFVLSGIVTIPGADDPVIPYRTGSKLFFVNRVENFVEGTKEVGEKYSAADWIESHKYLGKLIKEYSDYYPSLNQERKSRVNKALGKYIGMTMKAGIHVSIDVLKEIYHRAPAVLEGIYEGTGLKDFLNPQ